MFDQYYDIIVNWYGLWNTIRFVVQYIYYNIIHFIKIVPFL